jgi:cobalt-zinc-cadmium efflux system outer membrane protein
LRTATARVDLAIAATGALQSNLNAAIRDRFFDLLRLRAELQALQEDLQLTEQIRDRIDVRVRTGEAPRFDALRAEGEVAGVRKNLEATTLKLRQARFALRQLVSPTLEADFEVIPQPDDIRILGETDYLSLKYAVVERNPEIAVARENVRAAERQVEFERQQVVPQVTLRATQERDPTASLTRLGATVTLPLINRREGPIAEARASAQRAQLALEQRRFEADAAFEAAWQAYRAALSQVQAIEGGILERSRRVVSIAEAAYRLGERGILEYLDAQRQFRQVRNELLTARFELQRARTDLERLAGR